MRKTIIIVIILITVSMLTGCDKVIDSIEIDDTVVITRSFFKPPIPRTQTINGNTTTIIDPAIYRITVEYKGKSHNLSGTQTYNKYKKRLKEEVPARIKVNKHQSGNISYKVIELEPISKRR